jgi:hypothetical protein
MSFSYSKDPSASKLDECRFLLGDTNADTPILQDEEINYIIKQSGSNSTLMRYMLFNQAATIFARAIKRSLGPQSEDPTSRLKYYETEAAYYKQRLAINGISVPKYAYPKVFHKGMQNNPPWRRGSKHV